MGRPKDKRLWDQVDREGSRWKCRYCGGKFSGGATRIGAHLFGIEGRGIIKCPNAPHSVGEDGPANNSATGEESVAPKVGVPELGPMHSHSSIQFRDFRQFQNPGAPINDRPSDCNNNNVIEGKTLQQVDIDMESKPHEIMACNPPSEKQVPYYIGPFLVSCLQVEVVDLQLIGYVFHSSRSCDNSEEVVKSKFKFSTLHRSEFTTLKPKDYLDSMVIDFVAENLTYKNKEVKKGSKSSIWCLPLSFSDYAFGNEEIFIELVNKRNIRSIFMSNLADCEKMLIPSHIGPKIGGHYYLYVIHMKEQVIDIWDSLPGYTNIIKHRDRAKELLLALDKLFVKDIDDSYYQGWAFANFSIDMAKDTPIQTNGYDCGIFVINFMTNFMKPSATRNSLFQSDEQRLALALELLKSDINEQREELFSKATKCRLQIKQGQQGVKDTQHLLMINDQLVGQQPEVDIDGGVRRIEHHLSIREGGNIVPTFSSLNGSHHNNIYNCIASSSNLQQGAIHAIMSSHPKHLFGKEGIGITKCPNAPHSVGEDGQANNFESCLDANAINLLQAGPGHQCPTDHKVASPVILSEGISAGDLLEHIASTSNMQHDQDRNHIGLAATAVGTIAEEELAAPKVGVPELGPMHSQSTIQFRDLRQFQNLGNLATELDDNVSSSCSGPPLQPPMATMGRDEPLNMPGAEAGAMGTTCIWGMPFSIPLVRIHSIGTEQPQPMDIDNSSFGNLDDDELVGRNFKGYITGIWKLLRDEKVKSIGLHGMGGVGKTTVVRHIYDQIRSSRRDDFHCAIWVSVSQEFSIGKLQNDIAEEMKLSLEGNNERKRAENLSEALKRRDESVLFILDDVWKKIHLQQVGIPLSIKSIKLIFTSRSRRVCQQMDCTDTCNNLIEVKPLSDEDAWKLFLLNLRFHENSVSSTLPAKVLEVAKLVAQECKGLPLGIRVMATTMKGVEDIHEWRHVLRELRNSTMRGEMEEEVFKVLRISYDRLNDKKMQNCFLYCALYPEDYRISRKELIDKFVDEGLIKGTKTLQEIYDEGHTVLNKLIGNSLLICWGEKVVCMHDLVRDMACQILSPSCMVKCGQGLTEIPPMEEWTANLEKVSLMLNRIEEIPSNTSPHCRQLSCLLFRGNDLRCIPDCFLIHMNALTVLDLSYNENLTSLPSSLSNLKSLISLLLRGCESLELVPPLGQLQSLSRLDLSRTSIHQVPQGLEMLINLKWLDLSWNTNLEFVPGSVLHGLTNLQYLNLENYGYPIYVEVQDGVGMSMLEYCVGGIYDSKCFNDFIRSICKIKEYFIRVEERSPKNLESDSSDDDMIEDDYNINHEGQTIEFGDCKEITHLLPRDVHHLSISRNNQWRCLCDVLSFHICSNPCLRHCAIDKCPKLESLFCLSGSCSLCANLQNLRSLHLHCLESLADIWNKGSEEIAESLPTHGAFSCLAYLQISDCDKMEILLNPQLMALLQNLVSIDVRCCNSMKEIFAVESDGKDQDSNTRVTMITLPKLQVLVLDHLPQLKTVCKEIMACDSFPKFSIHDCPKLEKLPEVLTTFQLKVYGGSSFYL